MDGRPLFIFAAAGPCESQRRHGTKRGGLCGQRLALVAGVEMNGSWENRGADGRPSAQIIG